jgi:ankyrin repeat protein
LQVIGKKYNTLHGAKPLLALLGGLLVLDVIIAIKDYKIATELLLPKGADVNAKDGLGDTPLADAARHGQKDVAELLLANKADVNAKDDIGGLTPLHKAAWEGHKDVVKLLVANGADVNAKDKSGGTPMTYAEQNGQDEVAEFLRHHGGH